jgi:hypothetical protein
LKIASLNTGAHLAYFKVEVNGAGTIRIPDVADQGTLIEEISN